MAEVIALLYQEICYIEEFVIRVLHCTYSTSILWRDISVCDVVAIH